MDTKIIVALTLSLVGGLSTALGALLVIFNRTPNLRMLGLLQGFAAGFMLCVSFLDLVHNAINSIGFMKANLWFFSGALLFSLIMDIFPEPDSTTFDGHEKELNDGANKDLMRKHCRRVVFSVLTSAVVAGISLQNFPEGTAVFLGSTKGLHVGFSLGLAVALHYIPEGVAVALPAYFATGSKWEAFKLATLSGFAEPLGVIAVAYLFPSNLDPEILEGLLGSVGGVMAVLTFHELLPLAFDYAGHGHATRAVFIGMAFMSAREMCSIAHEIAQSSCEVQLFRRVDLQV